MARPVTLTVTLPAEDVERLDAALAAERAARNQPADTTREGFAALLLGRALLPQPAMALPIGPGLLALARYVHSEARRRGWVPEGHGLEDFLRGAIYERLSNLMDYRLGSMNPRDLRMLDGETRHDVTGDQPDGWIFLFG